MAQQYHHLATSFEDGTIISDGTATSFEAIPICKHIHETGDGTAAFVCNFFIVESFWTMKNFQIYGIFIYMQVYNYVHEL